MELLDGLSILAGQGEGVNSNNATAYMVVFSSLKLIFLPCNLAVMDQAIGSS